MRRPQKNSVIIGVAVILIIAAILAAKYWQLPGSPFGARPTATPSDNLAVASMVPGTGAPALMGDTVTISYTETLADGTPIDSSKNHGGSVTFALGSHDVIDGWNLGIAGMKVGETRRLTIPANLAYGATGSPDGKVPPNASLLYEIELLNIVRAKK